MRVRSLVTAAVTAVLLIGGLLAAGPAQADTTVNKPPVGIAATPTGRGYWIAAADGGVFTFGDAGFYGSMGGKPLNAAVVGMVPTPSGHGYWLVASDGGIFNYGDAGFYGSMGGQHLNAPVVAIAATASGHGYWLVASDGGIFAYGDAEFYGSMGGKPLNGPVVGLTATPSGRGYWLVASDGGIFSYGDAGFYGSMSGTPLAAPMIGITRTPAGGYWTISRDGGVFAFGAAHFYGRVVYSGPTGSPTGPMPQTVTSADIKAIFGASSATIDQGLPGLNSAMTSAGITGPRRVAAFLAVISNESGFRFNALEGGCAITYCGRGFIQITGVSNYQAAGSALGHTFVSNHQEDARSLTWSAPIAGWFWSTSHNINALADAANINAVTRAVNGTGAPASRLTSDCQRFRSVLTYYKQPVPAGLPC